MQEVIPPEPAAQSLADPSMAAIGLTPDTPAKAIHLAILRVLKSDFGPITRRQALETVRKAIKWAKPEFERAVKVVTKAAGERPWVADLPTFENGDPRPLMSSAAIGLSEDPEWEGVLWFNEFTGMIWLRRCPPYEETACQPCDRAWTDDDELATTFWMQRAGLHALRNIVFEAVQHIAPKNKFHPVRDHFDALKWDGAPSYYFGCEDTPYTRAVFSKWMISGVARIYVPGCKCDCCLILEGKQGIGKSSALKLLAGKDEWFTDEISDFGSKDAAMQTRGKRLIELAELDSLGWVEVGRVKAFISRTTDHFRPPYGRQPIDADRQCSFGGSVNDNEYLKDQTGGRRFWPLACVSIDLEALARDRDQLLAEAVARYKAGEKWHLVDDELIALAEREQAGRYVADAWETPIEEWLAEHPVIPETATTRARIADRLTVAEVLMKALELYDKSKWTKAEQARAAACLKRRGWTRDRNGRTRFYWRPGYEPKE